MLTILHASDLHFGKHHDAQAARAFLEMLPDVSPDLLVLSGDFTQRAKIREFTEARGFLSSLPPLPVVVTPGNHDVPLYRVWERLFAPHRNYREFISPELNTVTNLLGATVVALDSTCPLRAIVNGRIRDRQLLFAAEAFRRAPGGDVRIVVLHHHLAPAPDYESDQVLPGFQRCLDAFVEMKVELILGGHVHRGYVADSRDVRPGGEDEDGIVIVHAGTTTSSRGRARERNMNSFNLIVLDDGVVRVTRFQRVAGEGGFVPVGHHALPRRGQKLLPWDPARGAPSSRGEADSQEVGVP